MKCSTNPYLDRPRFTQRDLAYLPWYPLEFNERVDDAVLDFDDDRPLTLYVNIPFCRTTCDFCVYAHHLLGNRTVLDDYLDAVEMEIALLKRRGIAGRPVNCISIGGGTPNLLSPQQIDRLCQILYKNFDVLNGAEVGMEGRPELFTAEKILALNSLPVTRFNCGCQSFNQEWLDFLGRNATSEHQFDCLMRIREMARQELHTDLIFWLPGQTLEDYEQDLQTLLRIRPTYFTCYHLRLTPHTTLYNKAESEGRPVDRDPLLEEQMYELTFERSEASGYHQFANDLYFTTTGEHRYVTSTWEAPQATIIAIGANAMGVTRKGHYRNEFNLEAYTRSVRDGQLPMTVGKRFTPGDRMERFMSLGMRRNRIDLRAFQSAFAIAPQEVFPGAIEWLEENGYATLYEDVLNLTTSGKKYAENISRMFYSAKYRDLTDREFEFLEGLAVREWNDEKKSRVVQIGAARSPVKVPSPAAH